MAHAMFHGRDELGQRILSGVDLAIDLATLGEYGLEPLSADGYRRQRADRQFRPDRRPGWEAAATTARGACGTSHHPTPKSPPSAPRHATQRAAAAATHAGERVRFAWGFPTDSQPVDFRAAIRRYAA